jgi:phage shock protein A
MDAYEQLDKARRKVAKWNRKAEKALIGAKYQLARLKLAHWEQKVMYWEEVVAEQERRTI